MPHSRFHVHQMRCIHIYHSVTIAPYSRYLLTFRLHRFSNYSVSVLIHMHYYVMLKMILVILELTEEGVDETLLIGMAVAIGAAFVAMVAVAGFLLRRRCLRRSGNEMNHSKCLYCIIHIFPKGRMSNYNYNSIVSYCIIFLSLFQAYGPVTLTSQYIIGLVARLTALSSLVTR